MIPACVPTKALLAFFSGTFLNRYAYAQFVRRDDLHVGVHLLEGEVYAVLRGLRDSAGGIDNNRIFLLRWNPPAEEWQAYHGPWHAWLKEVTRPADSAVPPQIPTE